MREEEKAALERLLKSTLHPKAPKEYSDDLFTIQIALKRFESVLEAAKKEIDKLKTEIESLTATLQGKDDAIAELRHKLEEVSVDEEASAQ